jgi:hypothetical protein
MTGRNVAAPRARPAASAEATTASVSLWAGAFFGDAAAGEVLVMMPRAARSSTI